MAVLIAMPWRRGPRLGGPARTTPLVMSERLRSIDGVDWGVLFAAATAQLAPVLLFVLAAQRCVIAGLTAGAVQG
jgi:multiple sugar transport system permease protein